VLITPAVLSVMTLGTDGNAGRVKAYPEDKELGASIAI
jgi:hypothetical protein